MESHCKRALRAQFVFLQDNVDLYSQLLDHLYASETITSGDRQIIKCEKTEEDKIGRLIDTLRVKGNDPWDNFMDALKKTKQLHVVQTLERELLVQEGIQKAHRLYEFKEEHSIGKGDFITDIGSRNFTDDELNKILETIHRGVTLYQNASDDEQATIRNIRRKSTIGFGMQTRYNNVQNYSTIPMGEWTTDDCVCWLRNVKPSIKEVHIQKLRDLELTGTALEVLEKEEIKEAFEDIPYFVGRQILRNRDIFIDTYKNCQNDLSRSDIAKLHLNNETQIAEETGRYCRAGEQDDIKQAALNGSNSAKIHDIGHGVISKPPLSQSNAEPGHKNEPGADRNQHQSHMMFHDNNVGNPSENAMSSDLCYSLGSGATGEQGLARCRASYESCDTQEMVTESSTEWSNMGDHDSKIHERNKEYTLGDIVEASELDQCDLLTRVTKFSELQLTKDTLRTFVSCLIQFIAGCMNERQNGILYFGVSAWDHENIKKGQVTGIKIEDEKEKYTLFFNKGIQKCFMPEQVEIVQQCYIIEFVPTTGACSDVNRYVVEIIVTPSNMLCRTQTFFVQMPKESKKGEFNDPVLYSIRQNDPMTTASQQLDDFMEKKQGLCERRQKEEHDNELTKGMDPALSIKLSRLLCEDEEKIPQGVFHVLVLGPTADAPMNISNNNNTTLKEDLSFIQSINWQAVFDFDPKGTIKQCFKIVNKRYIHIFNDMSDFSPSSKKNIENPDRLKKLQDDIRLGKSCPWIFANGYLQITPSYDVVNWVRKMKQYWKDTLQFLKYEMGEPRVKVVFLLMDGDNRIMVEAAEDLIVTFRENGICLSEQQGNIEQWQSELIRRNRITQEEMDEMCVIGMKWIHTNKLFLDSVDNSILQTKCCLPSASGKLCYLSDVLRNSLYELEILSMMECDDDNMSPRERASLSHKKEDLFYKGFEVDWWNFKFEGHVMKRELFDKVRQEVLNDLIRKNKYSDKYVSRIVVYHQPGAGGTTLGKHILWSFRKMFRCAVISSCTDVVETRDQIFSFRSEADLGHLNPVLLLLDNIEDEKVATLMAEVEEKAKHLTREHNSTNETTPLVCVFLHLVRYVETPRTRNGVTQHKLTHSLSHKEKEWMNKKYEHLESKFETNKSRIDPKLLISFNIMKHGFNQTYVRDLTEKLLAAVSKDEERMLLKFVSAVNSYDLSFRKLPTSAFDTMMMQMPYAPGPRRGKHAKSSRWESKLSPGLRTLINEDPEAKQSFAYIHSIRVSNEILAKEVFRMLKHENKQCTTDVYRELLDTSDIFNVKCAARDKLLDIINEILKKRDRDGTGSQKQFSPLILEMKEHEGVDKCVEVLDSAYNRTQDVYLAQQIARVYICAENWENAEKYGALIVDKSPNRSCLWDTYARVYLKHLTTKYGTLLLDRRPLSAIEVVDIIGLARKAIEKFEEEERVCVNEVNFRQVENAGLFGELETIDTLVKCLPYIDCFKQDKERVHRFLVGECTPTAITYLSEHNKPDDHLKFLKSMKDRVASCLCKLEDEFVQRKEEMYTETQFLDIRILTSRISKFAKKLSVIFGELDCNADMEMSVDSICNNRRRKIFRLSGGYSPMCIFKIDDRNTLEEIIELANQNIQTQCQAEDLMTTITAKLALSTTFITKQYHKDGERALYEDLSAYSIQLYEKRSMLCWGTTEKSVFLEPYLYYVMFNWPRRCEGTPKVLPSDIKNALKEWKDAYFKKFPQQKLSKFTNFKRETTQFFLAYGSGLNGYRTYKQLKANNSGNHASRSSRTFWRNPKTIKELQRFKGILINEGEEVKVELAYGSGNKDYITIPTSFPVRNQALWNKQVFMVIGFSWKGPKAYDVCVEDPTLDENVIAMGDSLDKEYKRRVEAEEEQAYRDEHKRKDYRHPNRISTLQEKLRIIEELKERRKKGYKPNQREEAMLRDEEFMKENLRREVEKNMRVDF